MKIITSLFFGFAISLTTTAQLAAQIKPIATSTPARKPKLMKFGWDGLTRDTLKANQAKLDDSPFDGLFLKLPDKHMQPFGNQKFDETAFANYARKLAEVNSPKVRESFAIMWITSNEGVLDWFDDAQWEKAEHNLRAFARMSKAGGLKGTLFDQEPYHGTRPWNYIYAPRKNQKNFSEYWAQVRKRGAQFMRIMQTEHPGLTLYTTRLYSIIKPQLYANAPRAEVMKYLEESTGFYGLWPAFVEGIFEVLEPNVRVIEGSEKSYENVLPAQFAQDRQLLRDKGPVVLDPAFHKKYAEQVDYAHAIYLEGILNKNDHPDWVGFHLPNLEQRLRQLESNVYHALKASDGYAFIFSEKFDWWKEVAPIDKQSTEVNYATLPTASYAGAAPTQIAAVIRRAVQNAQQGKPLPFDVLPQAQTAQASYKSRFKIGGAIFQADGKTPIKDVQIQVTNPEKVRCKASNHLGVYSCTAMPGWSGKITPMKDGVKFTPANRAYDKPSKETWGQSYRVAP